MEAALKIMNFIFISPNFPHTYWQFCNRLKNKGVNVLGIGDAPYEGLEKTLSGSLTEYYKVSSLGNYDEVFRATWLPVPPRNVATRASASTTPAWPCSSTSLRASTAWVSTP